MIGSLALGGNGLKSSKEDKAGGFAVLLEMYSLRDRSTVNNLEQRDGFEIV